MTRATVMAFVLFLAACGGDDSDPAPAATAQASVPPPPVATPVPSPEPQPPPAATNPPAVPPPPIEPDPPTEPEPEPETPEQPVEPPVVPPPAGYSVRELVIELPDAQPRFLGDDDSVAGVQRTEEVEEWGTRIHSSIFVLQPDGALRHFDGVDANGAWLGSEALAYYEGHYAAGQTVHPPFIGVLVGPESYILDTDAGALALRFDGIINQLLSSGAAVGTEGANWSLPLTDRAFYWNGDLMRTVPFVHDAQDIGSRALQLRDAKIYGTIGRGGEPDEQEQVFVWHLMETGPDVVMVYPLGHPEYSIEPEPELPEPDSLHELIDEDDWWFGRVTFTHVHDVNAQGAILADGCTIAGCGSFVLSPPQADPPM